MAATSKNFSPFEQQLLNHISQINSNVNTLIQVFVNFQSTLLTQKLNNNKETPSTLSPSSPSSITNKLHLTISPIDVPNVPNALTSISTTEKYENQKPNQSKTPIVQFQNLSITKTHQKQNNSNDKTEEKYEKENKNNDDDEPILSLDSSDSDSNDGNQHQNKKNVHTNKNKLSSFNRSKSTSSNSVSSMTTLLRANHIRTHNKKYNGSLRHKFKKSSNNNQSESVLFRGSHLNYHKNRNKRKNKGFGGGPTFDPEHIFLSKNNRILINVGGSKYETTINTLAADQSSMLSAMFSGRYKMERDDNGAIFIDRDPKHFRHILNFLRDGIEYLKHGGLLQQPDAIINELLQEAKYYNIAPLVDYIQLQQTRKNKKKGDELTHEKQYKLCTNIAYDEFEDVFNKYTGSNGYDFEQWLYVQPFKTSRNNSSSPSFSMLFSKALSRAEVRLLDRLTDFQ